VILDASGSYDRQWPIISYYWMVSGGTTTVDLSSNSEMTTTFIAPNNSGLVSILLIVTNNNGETDTDTVKIVISSKPTADAGPDQAVTGGDAVFLNGSLSSDPICFISNYQWQQINGISVSLDNSSNMESSFTAPAADSAKTLTFQLIVTNNAGGSDSDIVNIHVNEISLNLPPVADADNDQTVAEKDIVKLDASKTIDPDGFIISYVWKQTDSHGALVSLSNSTTVTSTFKAPEVDKTTSINFTLTVQDNDGSIDTDDINIVIEDTHDGNGGDSCFVSTMKEL